MNTTHHLSGNNMTIFLLGAIFNIMASTEWASLGDYTLRAVVGGIVWLGFKLIGDFISQKYIKPKNTKADGDGK